MMIIVLKCRSADPDSNLVYAYITREIRRIGGLLCCLSGREHVHYHKVKRLVQ